MFFIGHTKLCVKQAHLAKHWLLKHPDVIDTNEIYKIPDRDGKFKDLNASFGRVFIDERFYIKPTMRGQHWLYNEFGDFKWSKDVTLYRWYLEYANWKDSESYKDLAKQYQWYKDNTDFGSVLSFSCCSSFSCKAIISFSTLRICFLVDW